MRIQPVILCCCFLLALATSACNRGPAVAVPQRLILYSVDGRELPSEDVPATSEQFHDYPVLGKIEVTDAGEKKEIMAALSKGIAEPDGPGSGFWPRHAIQVVQDGQTVDYVICFECRQMLVFPGSMQTKTVARAPQKVFNKYLKKAGIPLAPGMKDEGE